MSPINEEPSPIQGRCGLFQKVLIAIGASVCLAQGCGGKAPNLGQETIVVEVALLAEGLEEEDVKALRLPDSPRKELIRHRLMDTGACMCACFLHLFS